MDYREEVVRNTLEDHGVSLPDEVVNAVAEETYVYTETVQTILNDHGVTLPSNVVNALVDAMNACREYESYSFWGAYQKNPIVHPTNLVFG